LHIRERPSLISDNSWNLELTFDLSVWIRQGGPIQVIEKDEVHGVEGWTWDDDDQAPT
jgi:hypothetical protein